MPAISSTSLFHYTKKKSALWGILENGFRFSYCFEQFDDEIAKFTNKSEFELMKLISPDDYKMGIAIPMVCFCDIPLLRADTHRIKYGKYCIGLDKDKVRMQLPSINPVFYASSNWIQHSLEKIVEVLPSDKKLRDYRNLVKQKTEGLETIQAVKCLIYNNIIPPDNYNIIPSVNLLLSLLKTDFSCYNEREWRIFFNEDCGVKYNLTQNDFDKCKDEYNKSLVNSYSTFSSDVIKHIIVNKESEIPNAIKKINRFRTILGKEISYEDKQLLISKITSFERIRQDF